VKEGPGYLVTIGTFDGVHLGHQKLLRWVQERAREAGLRARIVFFVHPPHFFFRPDHAIPLLTTSRERKSLILEMGIDRVEVLNFGPRWAKMPHERFFSEYIVKRWKAGGIYVGRDFAFGKGRQGDLRYLEEACRRRGLGFGILPLVRVHGRKISSSRIRKLLSAGEVARADLMLGRPYSVSGVVVHGEGLGRKLGFPTANLRLAKDIIVPPGVFHVRVFGGPFGSVRASERAELVAAEGGPAGADAVCSVGYRPTVKLRGPHLLTTEVHIIDWEGDLYGDTLRVEFLQRLRGEKKFSSLDALKRGIRKDIDRCRSNAGGPP